MEVFSHEKYIIPLLTHLFNVTKFPLIVTPLNETTYIQHSLGIFCEWLCISPELSGSYLQTKQTSPIHIFKHKKRIFDEILDNFNINSFFS